MKKHEIIAIDHGNSYIKMGSRMMIPAGLADAHGIADETVEYRGKTYALSLEGGVNRLCNDIARALSSELGVRAERDQIELFLRGGETLFDYFASHLMESMAARFTARLLDELREHDIDLRTTPSVFIGGGALLLRRFLEASPAVKAPVFIEDTCANAVGYKMLAEAELRLENIE